MVVSGQKLPFERIDLIIYIRIVNTSFPGFYTNMFFPKPIPSLRDMK